MSTSTRASGPPNPELREGGTAELDALLFTLPQPAVRLTEDDVTAHVAESVPRAAPEKP